MTTLLGLGFTAPWLLLGLAALPILWLILRAIPPAPVRRRFPGVALLLGLKDDEATSDRTPWWLMLIRMLALAAIILGLAGPVLNPQQQATGRGPLLFVLDANWAGAPRWADLIAHLDTQLAEAGRAGRPVAILSLTAPEPLQFQSADAWRSRLPGLKPAAWLPTEAQLTQAGAAVQAATESFDSRWLSDGLAHPGRAALIAALQAKGALTVYETGQPVIGIGPASFQDGAIHLTLYRSLPGPAREMAVLAQGLDPAGTPRMLASTPVRFEDGALSADLALSLPAELRARVTRFEVQGQRSAGAVTLTDDRLRRREVALIAGRENREGLELLSPLHYLQQALKPSADLLHGGLMDLLPANPDVIVLADVATLAPAEKTALTDWVEKGGMLLRFAGPHLAASDVSRAEEDPLMPVRLRSGGRTVGGAMSWGAPKTLAAFPPDSPFAGLPIPADVSVSAQVMAQPDPTLADRVIAALTDGTPLVTRKNLGQGQVVLFHVTANAEWSSLPLSGLFVQMLERLAISSAAKPPSAEELAGTTWRPVQVMDGFGTLSDAGALPGVDGPTLAAAPLGPDLRPGVYDSGKRRLARNVLGADDVLTPADWPANVPVETMAESAERPIGGPLLALALVLLALDVIASLALGGRLLPQRGRIAAIAIALLTALPQGEARAQATAPQPTEAETEFAIRAAGELTLAHVLTGNTKLDDIAQAGLKGLSDTLFFRTSIEPAVPIGIDLDKDELAFFPFLYWPITPDQPRPSDAAYAKLNDYLRSGGMILFDTRDADVASFGAASPNGRKLQEIAAPLDIPPLEPVPRDHVLTRTFYLLQDFPGRSANAPVWVEAAPPDAEQVEGMPFRNLNDGVTPVVIGGNDWAGAWAVDRNGNPLLPVGRGMTGERQRELSLRFGVNLVMYVLTGNYKSDQVHVPALLDRLGQ
ncbi:DUF4159 domain-containing protein [Pseudodonghicola sp.]|uniref:DUF4159 domain-containing protein n=1 Tax=Pseudodonghicola sp. TaxID=1969463 RepID=UPI003A97E78A